MKKKRFMKLLALASCVTLLTGCESEAFFGLGKYWNQFADWGVGLLEKLGLKEASKKEEKQSEDQQGGGEQGGEEGGEQGGGEVTPEPQKSIAVENLPEKIDVIETLDLDDYVVLEGFEDYEVALDAASEDLAELDGHKLSTLAEGNIKFTVSAGELSQKCSIECVSATREFLFDAFDEAKNRYTIYEYDFDDNDQPYVADYIVHSDLYLLTKRFAYDANQNIVPGGWLSFEGEDFFKYTIEEDSQGEEQVVLGEQANPVYMSVYNPVIDPEYYFEDNGVFEYDEQYDEKLIVLTGSPALYFAEEALMCYQGEIETTSGDIYTFSKIQFALGEYEDDVTGETLQFVEWYAYVMTEGDTKEYLYGFGEILFGDEAGDELLDAYCIPANKPEGTDYWNYFNPQLGLGDFVLSPQSYVGATGIIDVDYGWFDENGAAIAEPESWGLPVGSDRFVTSPTSIWMYEGQFNEQGELAGYALSKGKMLVAGEGSNPSVTYNIYPGANNSFLAEEADEGVWEKGSEVFAGLRDKNNYAPGSIIEVEDFTHMVPGENEGDPEVEEYYGTTFTFNTGKVGGLLNAVVAADNNLYAVSTLIDYYASHGVNILNYFSGSFNIYPSYGVYQLSMSFATEDGYWTVSVTSMYNPSAGTQAASNEAYMLANVINAQ